METVFEEGTFPHQWEAVLDSGFSNRLGSDNFSQQLNFIIVLTDLALAQLI